MPKYKIIFDKNKCIGALNCIQAAPEFWVEDGKGKVNLVNAKELGNNIFELEIDEKDAQKNKLAAKLCTPKAIKVEEI